MLHRLFLAAIAAVLLAACTSSSPNAPVASSAKSKAPVVRTVAAAKPAPRPQASLVTAMRRDLGKNPTGWKNRWCAVYLRDKLRQVGHHAAAKKTDNRAISFLKLKRTRAKVGSIAVMRNHVCTVTQVMANSIRCIGGNQGKKYKSGRKVSENVYPRSRILRFVTP
jgi:hypothetical protein